VYRGKGQCSGCGKDREYALKKEKLCQSCYMNRDAARSLKGYVETVNIPNEYNRSLFRHLVPLINWETADEKTRLRFRHFGRFLQRHQFKGPLTWEGILELKAALPGNKYLRVHSCLRELGELLLDPSKDETLEERQRRIQPLIAISSLEADVISLLKKYDLWLRTERKNTPSSRGNHLTMLAGFWRWCARRGLTSFAAVEVAYVEEYLHVLGLKWRCLHCSSTRNLIVRGESPPTACENLKCGALDSYDKAMRCSPRTVHGRRSQFHVFFGWLKDTEEGIEINPAPVTHRKKWRKKKRGRRTRTDMPTIQYYDWEVIDALLKAIEDPKTPVAEAMALYLLLYHAFYVKELKSVQIPSQCRPSALGVEPSERLEEVLTLELKPRELSRGKQFLGRTGGMLQLEPKDEPWLKDLFGRFMLERSQELRDPKNPYLFVASGLGPRGGPASDHYFRLLIKRATARITGRICTASILGKCSRVLYAEFGGHEGWRHLRELGLGEQHARSFAWAKRVRVVPKQASQNPKDDPRKHLSNLTLPPIDVFGIPTVRENGLQGLETTF
jgi:hypothetical protein